MKPLTDEQLLELGFTLLPKVTDHCNKGFSYRVAEIRSNSSFIEVINEYDYGVLTQQFQNFEIIQEDSKPVDVELIKKLKKVML